MELTVSIAAVLIALAAFVLQIIQWRRNGPRPKVVGVILLTGRSSVLRVTVRNLGSTACQLRSIELRGVEGYSGFDPLQYLLTESLTLPVQIEPRSSIVAIYRVSAIAAALNHHGDLPWRAHVIARFGDGTVHISKGWVTIDRSLLREDEPKIEHGVVRVMVSSSTDSVPTQSLPARTSRRLRLGRLIRR